jgi:hypothetical protein
MAQNRATIVVFVLGTALMFVVLQLLDDASVPRDLFVSTVTGAVVAVVTKWLSRRSSAR